jgi:beta-glucanase (GH16 family)
MQLGGAASAPPDCGRIAQIPMGVRGTDSMARLDKCRPAVAGIPDASWRSRMFARAQPSCLRIAAPALILAALSLALPTSAVSATRTYTAVNVHCDVATFKLVGLKPASVRAARVTLGQREAQVKRAVVRRAARRGKLRLRLSTLRWTIVRTHTRHRTHTRSRTHSRRRPERHAKPARREKHSGCRAKRARTARVRRKRPRLIVITSDTPTSSDPAPTPTDPAPQPAPTTLKFQDEFNGAAGTAPDSTKWSVYGGTNPPRWGAECFVNDRSHVFQDGQGNLVLRAHRASSTPCGHDGTGAGILSGGMETGSRSSPRFTFKYGDSEARIAVDCLTGLWATYWHSGGTAGVSWPTDGEIDVMEMLNNGTGANQALWMPGGHVQSRPTGQWCGTGYHTYRALWQPGSISFYIDGNLVKTWTPINICAGCTWPFDVAGYVQRIIAELSIGGAAGTPPASFDITEKIDYIRVKAL